MVIYSKLLEAGTLGHGPDIDRNDLFGTIEWRDLVLLVEGIIEKPDSRRQRLWLRRKVYGKMSEKHLPLDPNQLLLFEQEHLTELGWKPFKPDSKIQPNCCAKFTFGGNHDRTLEMAFETQTVNLDKGADSIHLQRCPEIEQWAKDVYDWCAKRYGQENIIGFQVHLDEINPHIHALIVPVGQRAKSGRECVM